MARYRGFWEKNGRAGDGVDNQMSNEEKPGCLVCIGDSTAQLYGDYHKLY